MEAETQMKFVILAPPYTDCSSGVRALYRTCHWLNTLGQTAYMFTAQSVETVPPEWDVRYALFEPPAPDDVIAVYAEIYPGNPLGAKHVARFVLNIPGLLGGDKVYADTETIFYAPQLTGDDYLKDAAQKAAGGREVFPLQTSVHEPHLFYPTQRKDRKGTCYFHYKGFAAFAKSGHLFPTSEWRLIDRSAPLSRAALADLFHRSEALYSWDAHSAITREAALCGCPTFIVDENGVAAPVPEPDFTLDIDGWHFPPEGIQRLLEMAR